MTQQSQNPYGNNYSRAQGAGGASGAQGARSGSGASGAQGAGYPQNARPQQRNQQAYNQQAHGQQTRARQQQAHGQYPQQASAQQRYGRQYQQQAQRAHSQAHQQHYPHQQQYPQQGRTQQRLQQAQPQQHTTYNRAAQAQAHANASYSAQRAQANRARTQANMQNPAYTGATTAYNDYTRYANERERRHRKNPVAIIISLVLLAGIGVGVYFYLNPLSYEITVNGVKHTVDRGATIQTVLDAGMATPTPGDLLAIDGTIAQAGGGTQFSATVNGTDTTDATTTLKKNDVIEITNGTDTTETFQTTTEEVPYEQVESDTNYWAGSLHVYIQGVNGVRTTKTGDVSGVTITEDTQPVVNEEYRVYTADTGDDKVIALTFDDGPWPDTTEEILDILAQYDAKATFFTIGNQVSTYSSSVKRAYDEGHQVCTHSWDHASGSGQGVNLTYMSADEQITEVQKGFEAIKEVTGVEPSHVMRAPGGNFYGSIIWTLQPYITAEIGWNVDTEDWRRPGADTIAERIMSAKSGQVVLMHDGGGDRSQTVEALKKALPVLAEQGYKFVTVDELLAYGTN